MALTINGTTSGVSLKTDTSNIGLGANAVDSITTGDYNVGIGDNALTANTTASNNTALGYAVLQANTTGNENTAIGYQALVTNTTGANNIAIGGASLQLNTTGANNTASGYGALYSNTTGGQNTSSGYKALFSNTTGIDNTAFGKDALKANTTANNNTAVGRNALTANTTGASNVAVGRLALTNNTTGLDNTTVGAESGQSLTTGSYNTLIGYQAGQYDTAITTGTRNVIVGAFAYNSTGGGGGVNANCFGYNIGGADEYTTIGYGTSDIRAAHGTATWSTVSDERYKKDIVDSTVGLTFVNALQPRTFKYKTLGELPNTFRAYKEGSTEVFKNSNTNHGFIAQEVKAAIDADSSIKDGFKLWDDREDGSQEVAEAALIPVLVKAIQELSAKNEALLTRIEALEG